jgi:hypothetical protein
MDEFRHTQVYKEYSKDMWDYLIHMPYMPSRFDRDILLKNEDKRRVKIWDYFFRINPQDVGIPQQQEIKSLKEKIDNEIAIHDQKVKDINLSINELKRDMARAKLRRLAFGSISLSIGLSLLHYILTKLSLNIIFTISCVSPIFLYSLIMLIGIVFLGVNERAQINDLKEQIQRLHIINKEKVDIARKRIRILEVYIKELQRQIPDPPSDEEVRHWLTEDFTRLWNKSKDSTGLGTRLLNIRDLKNPIPILGPGELQRPERLPPQYTVEINLDLNKHLTARRAFYFDTHLDSYVFPEMRVEVLYGVYYLEYILIADDMLATHGLFYDFITGKESSEQTTEQYYKDVVAIATAKEFRKISIDGGGKDIIYIDDAPTFVLSLADGEKRAVTFVNEKYFKEIKEKIDISEDNISKIYWIQDSQKIAENAIKALRFRLRKHKGTSEDDSDLTS